jgi:putative SOS response-associated peptidase YedK
MCGRFTRRNPDPAPFPEFSHHWPQLPPRFNVAPSEEVLVLRIVDGAPRAELARWGLRPKWLKDASKAQINARSETAAEKPFFRDAWKRSRCLIVADGWYEWQPGSALRPGAAAAKPAPKQPFFFHLADEAPFTIGALWSAWSDEAGPHPTCAVLTTVPNALAAKVHDRMPVLVPAAERMRFLDPATPPEAIAPLCGPYAGHDLVVHPVDPRVNAPRNDDPACVEPIGPAL